MKSWGSPKQAHGPRPMLFIGPVEMGCLVNELLVEGKGFICPEFFECASYLQDQVHFSWSLEPDHRLSGLRRRGSRKSDFSSGVSRAGCEKRQARCPQVMIPQHGWMTYYEKAVVQKGKIEKRQLGLVHILEVVSPAIEAGDGLDFVALQVYLMEKTLTH